MWIRITNLSIKQLDARHLINPSNPDKPMVLNLFQVEGRTAFWVSKHKRVIPQFLDANNRKVVPKRKWTEEMKGFAQSELAQIPPQKRVFKLTVFGWIFFLGACALLGYLVYDGTVSGPQRKKQFEQRQADAAMVKVGDIYLGRIEVYKERQNPIGMEGAFGCFKVVKIDGDTYQIAKSSEMSKTAKPLEQMNSTDFEPETVKVQAKELSAYNKTFTSEDGLTEISFQEKKQ
ncbi:hypothetical protein GCM10027051_25600 [Niabella terrae]